MHYEEKTSKKVLLSDVEAHRMEIQARRAPEVAEGAPDDAPRVLMIDDNPDIRNFVGRALARTYRVELAEDGVDGIEKARLAPPDLIITDVMMPRMDGYEFCRTIRKDEAFRKTPIIIVTAEFGTEKIVKGLDVGASDFVQKPFEMRELEARVSAHLRTIGLERSLEERDRRLNVIGQMTSTIVHDLKNPLSNIIMYAQIARQDAVDEGRTDYVEDLDTVIRESKRLGLLIAEVLDFARGNISELQMERTVLKPFIEEMMKPLERQLFGHGVAIYFKHGAAEDLAVDLDRLRTQRVLENLVKNSREAILGAGVKTGESSIWISTSGAADGVVIRVADNGPGIPPEMAKTLFEPFATAGKKSGTGLGLAIARSQVSAQGGTIEVLEKPPEGGAAFVLKFPNPKLPA
jgi:signal transduction histidine kinase